MEHHSEHHVKISDTLWSWLRLALYYGMFEDTELALVHGWVQTVDIDIRLVK